MAIFCDLIDRECIFEKPYFISWFFEGVFLHSWRSRRSFTSKVGSGYKQTFFPIYFIAFVLRTHPKRHPRQYSRGPRCCPPRVQS